MFACRLCKEKDKVNILLKGQVVILEIQVKDLLDRLMAFNERAFTVYQSELKKPEDLFPTAVDSKGNIIDYKDVDLNKAQEEMIRGFAEEPIEVEERPEETAKNRIAEVSDMI